MLRTLCLTLLLALCAACTRADGAPAADGAAATTPPGGGRGPRAEDVTVSGVAGQYDLGDYFITGEAVNQLNVPIHDVVLEVEYLDAAGRTLATDGAAPVLTRVEPGGAVPFIDTHYAAPEGIAGHRVTAKTWSRSARRNARPLTILDTQSRAGITGAVVTGRARNDAGAPLTSVTLVTSFRDEKGTVTGVFFDYPVIGSMAPGQTVEFTVETMDDAVAGHAVTVQGEGVAP